MTLFSRLKSWWLGEPVILDHVAIRDSAKDWRDPKVIEAANRHGKPFKCASEAVPRETLLAGITIVSVQPGERPRHTGNVLPIRRKQP